MFATRNPKEPQSGVSEYGAMRMFFHFPVEQIPANANITSYFKLYMKSVADTQTRQYNAYTLNSSWSETGISTSSRHCCCMERAHERQHWLAFH